jgi:YD repeat-containing protein
MKKRILLAATAAILAFSSCKKDDPAPNNPTPGVEKKLKKITKTEAGTVTVYNLTYDAAGRLISYKSTDNTDFVLFTYDAAGNLIKLEQQDHDFRNIYEYHYTNNIPGSATFKSWDISGGLPGVLIEDDLLDYTVANNRIEKIKLTMQGGAVTTFNLTYTNGNLTKVNNDGVIQMISEFTYGTKKPMYPKVTNWVLDQAGFSLQFAANHEVTKVVHDFPGTNNDQTINVAYTYDAAGYVLTSNDGVGTQQVFEYQ